MMRHVSESVDYSVLIANIIASQIDSFTERVHTFSRHRAKFSAAAKLTHAR